MVVRKYCKGLTVYSHNIYKLEINHSETTHLRETFRDGDTYGTVSFGIISEGEFVDLGIFYLESNEIKEGFIINEDDLLRSFPT